MNDINQDPNKDQEQGTPVPPTSSPDCETCPFRKAMEDAENSKTPKGHRRLIDEIRDLELPSRIRSEIFALSVRARDLGRKVIRFIKRHRHLGESIVLGCLVSYLLCHIPFIGAFLGLCALALTISAGVLRELQESIAALFAADIPVYA